MSNEETKPKEVSAFEKAKNLLKDSNVVELMEADAKEKGWDIGLDDGFIKETPMPVVRLMRKCTVGDTSFAEMQAKQHYTPQGVMSYEPTTHQLFIAKLSILATFDGGKYNIPDIEALDHSFFTTLFVMFTKYLL